METSHTQIARLLRRHLRSIRHALHQSLRLAPQHFWGWLNRRQKSRMGFGRRTL